MSRDKSYIIIMELRTIIKAELKELKHQALSIAFIDSTDYVTCRIDRQ